MSLVQVYLRMSCKTNLICIKTDKDQIKHINKCVSHLQVAGMTYISVYLLTEALYLLTETQFSIFTY